MMRVRSLTPALVHIRAHSPSRTTARTTCPSVEPVSATGHTAHMAHNVLGITASSLEDHPTRPGNHYTHHPKDPESGLPSLGDPLEGLAEADLPGVPMEPEPPDTAQEQLYR